MIKLRKIAAAAAVVFIIGYMQLNVAVAQTMETEGVNAAAGQSMETVNINATGESEVLNTEKAPEMDPNSNENNNGQDVNDPGSQDMGEIRLKIEDSSIYEGMEKAYKDGYEPVVMDGQAKIVLPIIVDGDAEIPSLTVTPNLGDTALSPFVYKNYQKTFKASDEKVQNSKDTMHVFLVSYTLPLNSDRMNGIYPVVFDMTAKYNGVTIAQSFTVYVRITDGQSPDDGSGEVAVCSGGEETPTCEPKLIITKCTSEPAKLEAGNSFTLHIEIKNTSSIKYVQNMTIDVSCGDGGLVLEEDSSTFYVERLGSEETMEFPLHFKIGSNMAEGRYDIQLNMSYDNPDAVSLSSSGTISVDVTQPMRVELEASDFPESINAGDTVTLTLQVLNLGRGKIYNARCILDAPGLSSGTSAFLGNVEAGNAVSGSLKVFAGMKDEAVYGSAYGATNGKLILEYEDENGEIYTEEKEISTTVNPLVIVAASEEMAEDDTVGIDVHWIIGIVTASAVLAAAIGVILYRKKKGLM